MCLFVGCEEAQNEGVKAQNSDPDIQQIKYQINYTSDSSYTEFIEGLTHLHNQIELENDSISNEFECLIEFNRYFKVFDRLSIAQNWTLESHYRHFGDAGRPLLLAFEQGSKLGDSIRFELSRSFEGEEYQGISDYNVSLKLFEYQDSVNYLDPIQIDDSKMGYFQYVTFALIGDNYCLFWHSNYGEMSIITSKEQLVELTELEDNFYYKFSAEDKKNILKLDPEPVIELNEQDALVTVVTLSPWAGFVERTVKISKTWPHEIEQLSADTIMEYDCGILL